MFAQVTRQDGERLVSIARCEGLFAAMDLICSLAQEQLKKVAAEMRSFEPKQWFEVGQRAETVYAVHEIMHDGSFSEELWSLMLHAQGFVCAAAWNWQQAGGTLAGLARQRGEGRA